MENRAITIIATREQKKYVLSTGAETLAELKADMHKHGINYYDMTFMEGLSHTELIDDNSILPTNVPRTNRETGETVRTNELVFFLTNTNKKIKSGADRKELYAYIKEHGLQEVVKEAYGRNFTQVSTAQLEEFCRINIEEEEEEIPVAMADDATCNCNCCAWKKALAFLAETLADNEVITFKEYSDFLDIFAGTDPEEVVEEKPTKKERQVECPYSDDELDALLASFN